MQCPVPVSGFFKSICLPICGQLPFMESTDKWWWKETTRWKECLKETLFILERKPREQSHAGSCRKEPRLDSNQRPGCGQLEMERGWFTWNLGPWAFSGMCTVRRCKLVSKEKTCYHTSPKDDTGESSFLCGSECLSWSAPVENELIWNQTVMFQSMEMLG